MITTSNKKRLIAIGVCCVAVCAAVLGWIVYRESQASPHGPALSIEFIFDADSGEYSRGFTVFLAFLNEGEVLIPERWAVSPRKGFMDRVYGEYMIQSPEFWVEPGVNPTYRPPPKASFLLVGHRPTQSNQWVAVDKIPLQMVSGKEPENFVVRVPVSGIGRLNQSASKEEIASALRVLKQAIDHYLEIQNQR